MPTRASIGFPGHHFDLDYSRVYIVIALRSRQHILRLFNHFHILLLNIVIVNSIIEAPIRTKPNDSRLAYNRAFVPNNGFTERKSEKRLTIDFDASLRLRSM